MSESSASLFERLAKRYREGDIPWDETLPPPEILELVPTLAPGRALDLGTGYGRTAIYLAGLGWEVDAVDFIPQAIAVAAQRCQEVGEYVRFHLATIPDLAFLAGSYDLAIDIGCGHALDENGLRLYRDQLKRLLRSDAIFVLFVRLLDGEGSDSDENRPPGLNDDILKALFSDGFELLRADYGRTVMADSSSWTSAWFHFRRLEDALRPDQ